MVDNLLLLAIGAFGWGLSLATYRVFAHRKSWPTGALHVDLPAVPVVIGLFALVAAIGFAAARGPEASALVAVSGLLLATFWTGFLRVGSQMSLLLAPAAALLLILGWAAGPLG